ncbi:MAG: LysR substrate-binding domain-containing protein [Gammaproteobacteria bacterium]|nr:LysR substrate-binding domain-containing protein [Gammaproteobacteria bacterium]
MLQFRQIQAFHAIMRSGTVTGAARSLGISQPGVSNLIASLEHQLGFALFERITGRLAPTPEAHRLAQSTETAISGFDRVIEQASAIRELEIGTLEVAALPELSMQFLPNVISDFLLQKQDINLSFQARSSVKVQELVAGHMIEIGVAEGPIEHDNLASELFSYACFFALPASHRLAHKTLITPQDLHGEPLITLGPSHPTYHRLREIFSSRDCVWNDRCQARLFHSALAFAQRGLGAALVDPFTIDSQPLDDVVIRRFESPVAYDIAVIWAKDRPLSVLGSAFVDRLLRQMQQAQEDFVDPAFL